MEYFEVFQMLQESRFWHEKILSNSKWRQADFVHVSIHVREHTHRHHVFVQTQRISKPLCTIFSR
jgi:hypothetical protein